MEEDFSCEESLNRILTSFATSKNDIIGSDLISDERILFRLFNNISDPEASSKLVRMSFCIAVLALDEWKRNVEQADLPLLVYNYFQHIEDFICFSFSAQSADICKLYPSVQKIQKDQNPIMMFLPTTEKEKRLYSVKKEDIVDAIVKKKWNRLPDPRQCQCWIYFPKKTSRLQRKFSMEFKEGNKSEEGLAKMLIKRREKKTMSIQSMASSEARHSLFSKKVPRMDRNTPDASESELAGSPLSVKNISEITMQSQWDPKEENQTIHNFSRFLSPTVITTVSHPQDGPNPPCLKKGSVRDDNIVHSISRKCREREPISIPDPDELDFEFEESIRENSSKAYGQQGRQASPQRQFFRDF